MGSGLVWLALRLIPCWLFSPIVFHLLLPTGPTRFRLTGWRTVPSVAFSGGEGPTARAVTWPRAHFPRLASTAFALSLALLALASLTGCLSAPAMHALAEDHATVTHMIQTPWGRSEFTRSNPTPTNLCARCGLPFSLRPLAEAAPPLPPAVPDPRDPAP